MRIKMTLHDDFGEFGEKIQETSVMEDSDGTLQDALLTVIKAFMGHGFSEELICQYINYDHSNYKINKIKTKF